MKNTIQLTGAACAAALISIPNLYAQLQPFETDLDFQFVPAYSAAGYLGVAADALGNVFMGGSGDDTSSVGHGLVLKTDTTAATWSISDDFVPAPIPL